MDITDLSLPITEASIKDSPPGPNVVVSPQLTGIDTDNTDPDLLAKAKEEEKKKFFDFDMASIALRQIRDQWKAEMVETDGRRKTRDIQIDVDALRESGDIKEDETFIPVRIIDTNIKREQPAFINYLRNSRRIAIFKPLSNPSIDTQVLEQEFTAGMTYPGWEKSHFKCIDGSQTHGWDSIEVVLDTSNPLHVGLEQVGHEKLLFSWDSLDIQNCSRLMRAYDLTMQQLNKFVIEFGFDKGQVDILISTRKDGGKREEETFRVYKSFFKLEGIVYVSWCSLESGTSDWLKKPDKLFLGRKKQVMIDVPTPTQIPVMHPVTQQVIGMSTQNVPIPTPTWVDEDEPNYPIFILPYQETEKQRITEHKGRVFLDCGKQEAQTAVLTGFVNGITRASNLYASPEQDTADGGPMKITDIKLVMGAIMNRPMKFWAAPYPDPMILRALQYLDTNNANEAGDVNFATLNRQDSRKTARELSMSQDEATKLDSVQLTLFSTHIRNVYSFAWLIVQSRALQNLLPNFLLHDPTGQGQYVQDTTTISAIYDVRAAGDVDVVQKAEQLSRMQADWPVMQTTPLKDAFLLDYIKLSYPNDAERYADIMQQGDIKLAVIQELSGIIQQVFPMDKLKQLPPAEQQKLMQLENTVQQLLSPNASASKPVAMGQSANPSQTPQEKSAQQQQMQ